MARFRTSLDQGRTWGPPVTLTGDAGLTWAPPLTIDTSDGYCITSNSRDKLNRELSYPSIKQTADGRPHGLPASHQIREPAWV